jgi:hypothetical protein
MKLPAPARECSDAEIDAVIDYWDMRRQPQPLDPMDFRPAWYTAAQAAHAAMDYDDEPGPAQDRRSMGGLVLAIALGVVSVIALAVMVW